MPFEWQVRERRKKVVGHAISFVGNVVPDHDGEDRRGNQR
jgi:hypothetical protein